jgi:hypothetical protein
VFVWAASWLVKSWRYAVKSRQNGLLSNGKKTVEDELLSEGLGKEFEADAITLGCRCDI